MQLAKRMKNLGTENAFKVLAEVNKLKGQGKDIISFATGNDAILAGLARMKKAIEGKN